MLRIYFRTLCWSNSTDNRKRGHFPIGIHEDNKRHRKNTEIGKVAGQILPTPTAGFIDNVAPHTHLFFIL